MSHAKRLVDDLVSRAREDFATDAEVARAEARLSEAVRAKPGKSSTLLRVGAIGIAIGAVLLGVVALDRDAAVRKTAGAKAEVERAPVPVEPPEPTPEPVFEAPAPPARAPIAVARPEPAAEVAPPEAPVEEPVPDEIVLVDEARTALAGDPARALELTETHRRFHPRGLLVQERETLAIRALVALGRMDAARTRASRFFESFPGSAHRARIEELVRQNP